MIAFARTDRLDVFRRLSSGERTLAGQLAQNRQGVFFQYAADYLASHPNLAVPAAVRCRAASGAGGAPRRTVRVFADSLPEGWGTLVMDRVLRQHGVLPSQVTGMDRLAYVGDRAAGALEYAPAPGYATASAGEVALDVLGRDALALFDGADDPQAVPRALAGAGSSGGARPKAQIWLPSSGTKQVHLRPRPGFSPHRRLFAYATPSLSTRWNPRGSRRPRWARAPW